MLNNAWVKLAVVSLAGIVVSLGVLWGINQVNYNKSYNMNGNMNIQSMPQGQNWTNGNMNDMYRNGMQQWQYWQNNMNAQRGMNMQGNMNGNMQGNMNGGMNGGMMGR